MRSKPDCCLGQMTEAGTTITREGAKFIPAKMMSIQHIEHAYKCVKWMPQSTNETWE
ncbi:MULTISPECIES: IS66 family transposase zinc-finger binding domain-containing protein [Lysinibacillus]|uniref:IS66 family transposase zinc-finger binding domain-containing protein n=1 Tax=Lysinibacillus xylanilyticus TaxID=582475 RepID=A0ABV3VXK2_9BACI